ADHLPGCAHQYSSLALISILRSRSSRTWQPEHALGQDVPLDLGGAGEQRGRAVVEVRARQAAARHRVRARLPAEPARPEEIHQGIVHALAHLAPEELHEARLGAEGLPASKAR